MEEITNILGPGEVHAPPGVKLETQEQKDLFRLAQEFERFFVQSMTKQMNAATKALSAGSNADSIGTASTGAYEDMVQDAMTDSLVDSGGIGLAAVIYGQMKDVLPGGGQ